MKARATILLFAFTLLVGCATSGSNFNWDSVEQVQSGMTTAEVRELLGEPYMVTKSANEKGEMVELWVWSHAKVGLLGSSMESKAVSISFLNGVVSGQPTSSITSN